MTTTLFAHPYLKSFNHANLNIVVDGISKKSIKFEVLDLCNDKFDVVMVFFQKNKKKQIY